MKVGWAQHEHGARARAREVGVALLDYNLHDIVALGVCAWCHS